MAIPISLLILLFATFNSYSQDTIIVKNINGIEVSFYSNSNPTDKWKYYDSRIYYLGVKKNDIDSVTNCLKIVLAKYPEELLNKNLKKITVFGRMKVKGAYLSGLYKNESKFYLSIPEFNSANKLIFEKLFHHEFSHCLFKNYTKHFDKQEWGKLCLIKYNGRIWKTIRTNENIRVYDPKLYSVGFLHLYSTVDINEDFTSFAENIFLSDKVFWKAVSENDLLHQKFLLTIDFYKKTNPTFTESYFESNNHNSH